VDGNFGSIARDAGSNSVLRLVGIRKQIWYLLSVGLSTSCVIVKTLVFWDETRQSVAPVFYAKLPNQKK